MKIITDDGVLIELRPGGGIDIGSAAEFTALAERAPVSSAFVAGWAASFSARAGGPGCAEALAAFEAERNGEGWIPTAPLTFIYTNHRGETGQRKVIPMSVRFGSTEWHPKPQWLLRTWDLDKNAEREFAMGDIGAAPSATPMPEAPKPFAPAGDREVVAWVRENALEIIQKHGSIDGLTLMREPTAANCVPLYAALPAQPAEERAVSEPVPDPSMQLRLTYFLPTNAHRISLSRGDDIAEIARFFGGWTADKLRALMGQPKLRHALAAGAEEAAQWENEVSGMLAACPWAVRCCEGGGPEDLHGSLALTFTKIQKLLKEVATWSAKLSSSGAQRYRDEVIMAAKECIPRATQEAQTFGGLTVDELRLRFFRDLTDRQRLTIFDLDGLEQEAIEVKQHGTQALLFNRMIAAGHGHKIAEAVIMAAARKNYGAPE